MQVGVEAGGAVVDDVMVTGGTVDAVDKVVLASVVEAVDDAIVEVEIVLVGAGHALHPHFIDSYRT